MSVQTFLDKLENVKAVGRNSWQACCPAHDDRTPSLRVTELDDGRILVKCFAGCGAVAVMANVGMTMSDLYPDGAIADQLKNWDQMTKNRGKKSREFKDDVILQICESMRAQGKKLSPSELAEERAAYLRSRKGRNDNAA